MQRNNKEVKSTRINLTLSDELLSMIDDYCDRYYITRSALVAMAVTQKIQSDKLLDNMPEMMSIMKQAIDIEKAKTVDGLLSENGDGGEA